MIIASNGDLVVPASMAPIPTSANAPAGSPGAPPSRCSATPNKAPAPAPRNNVGVNTPPTVPAPTVATVASSLARNTPPNSGSGLEASAKSPCKILFVT